MKIIQIPYCYYPDPVGGTEIYVQSLIKHLREKGIESVVAAPGRENSQYEHNSFPIYRFALSPLKNLRELYGEGDSVTLSHFEKILDKENPDLIHFHAFSRGASLPLARKITAWGIPLVLTYHTPSVSCLRGTLLQWGKEVCEGRLDPEICTQCVLEKHGLPSLLSYPLSRMPSMVRKILEKIPLQNRCLTALRMRELVELQIRSFQEFIGEFSHIIAVCQWIKEVLERNQIDSEKITVIRQGVTQQKSPAAHENSQSEKSDKLKIIFLGRIDPKKGIDVLLSAFTQVSHLPLQLDIYGIRQEGSDDYFRKLQKISQKDSRIAFYQPISSDEVVKKITEYDLVAVPSQWLESGPFVVREAFVAGVPVLGSDLGGIAELVRDGQDGILLPHDDISRWATELERLCQKPSLLEQLKENIRPPQHLRETIPSILNIYQKAIKYDETSR